MRLCRSLSSTSLHVPVRGADVPVQVIPSFLSGVQKKKASLVGKRRKSLDTRIRTKDQQITTVTTTVCRSTGLSYVELKSAADFRHVVAHFYDISILYIFICVMPTPEVLV